MEEQWDVIVLGAGGAGMMCAATAARRGRRTLVLDHADKLGKKILISGGGRCNFTNTGAGSHAYFSENEHFAKSAMARFTPKDFVALVEKHGISYYEKKLGQLFCHDSAQSIVSLLREECDEAGAVIRLNTHIVGVEKNEQGFLLKTSQGDYKCESLVIATGGLSIPKIGATDFGYKIAEQFGLKITRLDPALVSLTMPDSFLGRFGGLSGASLDCAVSCNGRKFRENILFTHTGLSGPAILQISLHWFPGDEIVFDLSPDSSLLDFFMERKKAGSQKEVRTLLGERFTARIGEKLAEEFNAPSTPIVQVSDAALKALAEGLHAWKLIPVGTGGYGKAEVTRGGLSTDELSSKTLEAKKVPGLYFIGEVVDVTGWLGGYNFQWAWAS
ncbi:MAG: NAD(P)/FAD-dependent oxidoreductase, partial [Bdellovibrionota bacterium]